MTSNQGVSEDNAMANDRAQKNRHPTRRALTFWSLGPLERNDIQVGYSSSPRL